MQTCALVQGREGRGTYWYLKEVLVGMALLIHLSQEFRVGSRLGSPSPDCIYHADMRAGRRERGREVHGQTTNPQLLTLNR